MATCDACGSTIVFGGVKDGNYRFCNSRCHGKGQVVVVASQIHDDVVREQVHKVHKGRCPRCGKQGPIDVHTAYTVWSLIFLTSWRSDPRICCRSCGIKNQLGSAFASLVCGWWGIPWGLLITPVQVSRNLLGILKGPDAAAPSPKLHQQMRLRMAAYVLEQQKGQA